MPKNVVTVIYSPALRDWDEQIKAELRRQGLKRGEAFVIAKPTTVTNELFTTSTY